MTEDPLRPRVCMRLVWPSEGSADLRDLPLLVSSGLIWKCPPRAQKRAIDAILAGTLPMNDRVPPRMAEWIEAQIAQKT